MKGIVIMSELTDDYIFGTPAWFESLEDWELQSYFESFESSLDGRKKSKKKAKQNNGVN